MRGSFDSQPLIIAYFNLEKRVPQDHPLRKIKSMVDQELKRLSPHFDQMYSHTGRLSIPPERVLKSLLLVALDSVRSERQLCEQLDDNLLFRILSSILQPSLNEPNGALNSQNPRQF